MAFKYSFFLILLYFNSVENQQNDFTPYNNAAQRYQDMMVQRQPPQISPNYQQQSFQLPNTPAQPMPVQPIPPIQQEYYPRTTYNTGRNNNYQRNRQVTRDDVSYRYSPPTHRLGPNDEIYILTEERLREIRSEFMYWFFDKGGDDDNGDYQIHIHNSVPQIHKNFNFQLPFFGFRFNYTRVSMHGFLEFSDPPEQLTYPLRFPNKDWPRKNDPAFIGIFYSKCRIGKLKPGDIDKRRPGVYFRMERNLQSRTDQFGIEMRERLKWDIRQGVVGAETFEPKYAAIVTWKNMSFAGGFANALYVTNTFQLVLATDEVFTYVIFNYAEMQWTSHTEAGGDTTLGEGGVPAYVGFNAGNSTRSYEYAPYSQRSTIQDLVGRGWANGFPGRHIFRIDENIMLGTCNKDIAGTTLPLMFAPESGNMLGGTIVNITGPCFEPNMKVRCKFDTEEVVGVVIDRNRAVCVQPFLMVQGYVIFDIAVGNERFNWKGKYFVETPATATTKIFINSAAIHEVKTNQNIVITWDRQNLTTNYDARLRLTLWGYKETTITPELLYIDTLEDNIPNTGSYTIYPETYAQRNNGEFIELSFGFLQISIAEPEKYFKYGIAPILWSKPIPLGWYFLHQWEREYGPRWADTLCNAWLMNDRYLKNFAAEIPMCPCKVDQAMADKGRYLPDYDCDLTGNPNCFYNKGALQCVRTGAPSLVGSEQQCCYDKNDFLMLTYDQKWGSKPKRSHNLGYLPWNEANKVPTLSQWFHDISPFYTCCLWQEEESAVGCETFRFERRPSQDCVGYQAPYVATVFGDPHFITFDDLDYTFNGKGEFVLVHTDTDKHKLDVQARFEQVDSNIYGPVMATRLTAIAARDNSSTIIEVRIRPKEAQWRYRLDVLADGKRIYFDRDALRLQHFHGVTVYTPPYILNQSEIIMMFESGVGVEVLENKGSMSARVYLPWQFINKTKGLFGTWNFRPLDDFTLPDGTILSMNRADFRSVHDNFGLSWLLEDRYEAYKGGALFFREYGRTASYFANRTFSAEWGTTPEEIIPPNRTEDIRTAYDICGNSYQCKYDYAVTLNEDLAKNTLKFQNSFVNIKERAKLREITCGILETPRFGRKSNFYFIPETKVTFECDQGFVLIGDQRRTCTEQGTWDIPEHGYTECLRLIEYESQTAWTTILIISLVIVPLLVAFCCVLNTAYKRGLKQGSNKSWNFTSAPALRRRSSILALSSANLTEIDKQEQLRRTYSSPILDPHDDASPLQYPSSSSTGPKFTFRVGSAQSSPHSLADSPKHVKRKYDGVYRTNEPLPGKPMIEFEDKVWDLEDEYNDVNARTRRAQSTDLEEEEYDDANERTRKAAAMYYESARGMRADYV